tara:strand:+ start:38 stop:418 length:381 start_codon:yes stop_codon:yes gene_type:complete
MIKIKNIAIIVKMSNDYFPGIGLFNLLTREEQVPSPAPAPAPAPEPETERDPNVIYAEPIGENREIIKLKQKIKILEDKVRALTQENINLRNRLELENSIEKIYDNLPSLEKIGETLQNVTHNVGR